MPNVQDEPRPWLARLVLLGARDVTAMVVALAPCWAFVRHPHTGAFQRYSFNLEGPNALVDRAKVAPLHRGLNYLPQERVCASRPDEQLHRISQIS